MPLVVVDGHDALDVGVVLVAFGVTDAQVGDVVVVVVFVVDVVVVLVGVVVVVGVLLVVDVVVPVGGD